MAFRTWSEWVPEQRPFSGGKIPLFLDIEGKISHRMQYLLRLLSSTHRLLADHHTCLIYPCRRRQMPPRDLLQSLSGNPVLYTSYFGAEEPDLQVSGSSEKANSWARQDQVEGTP